MGLEKLSSMIGDMAQLSEKTVITAIDAYVENRDRRNEIRDWSEKLRILQEEVSELAVELIGRFQPVASDLRYIKSCMEIAYGFSRFGRYAFDIAEVLRQFGDLSACDHSEIRKMSEKVKEMMKTSTGAFTRREAESDLVERLEDWDNEVDAIYFDHVKRIAENPAGNLKCAVSATLILRYLERIADHAVYIGESVAYISTGERSYRR